MVRSYTGLMTQGYPTLTEKEKQTLRLLVAGYDAKSMARHLGLSVHTINERLRYARRKMTTSSSREAARLLREVEGPLPELLGDKQLGGASAHGAAQVTWQPAEGRGTRRRIGWIVGGISMSITLALLALSALSSPSQVSTMPLSAASTASSNPASEQPVIESARQWLALIDRDDWSASWQVTGESFRSLNTVERWTKVSKQVRASSGSIQSRELVSVNFAPAPPQGYWIVKFKASYSKGGSMTETLSLAWDEGGWKVVGITVE